MPDMSKPESTRMVGLLFVLGAVQFVLAMIIVQVSYPGYSDFANPISDLGNSAVSSLAWLYNSSIVMLGIAGLFATYFLARALARKLVLHIWSGFFTLGNVGLILVGLFPENTSVLGGWAHSLAGQIAFPSYAVSLIAAAFAVSRDPGRRNHDWFSLAMGLVGLVSVLLYGSGTYLILGPGGMERLFLGADLAWMLVIGVRFTRPLTFKD